MEASQMYCDLPPQSAFNFAGYTTHSMPPTPPTTEEEQPSAYEDTASAPSKRPAASPPTTTLAEATTSDRPPQGKRPKREPSPDIDIVNVAVVRSSSPDVLKPRQEKIWRPYGATDE